MNFSDDQSSAPQTISPSVVVPALSANQRNIYRYFLHHRKKWKNAPCFVPKLSTQTSRLKEYLTALQRLEEYNLISIDRSGDNYMQWIIKDPIKQTHNHFT